jgi:hypothetical protein
MMVLEAESGLRRMEILAALASCNVSEVVEDKKSLTGNFPRSNMYFVLDEFGESSSIAAEGASDLTWSVASTMTFYYVTANFDECSLELHKFLRALTESSKACFVLSFQYERLYALRDQKGLHIFEKF